MYTVQRTQMFITNNFCKVLMKFLVKGFIIITKNSIITIKSHTKYTSTTVSFSYLPYNTHPAPLLPMNPSESILEGGGPDPNQF